MSKARLRLRSSLPNQTSPSLELIWTYDLYLGLLLALFESCSALEQSSLARWWSLDGLLEAWYVRRLSSCDGGW